MLGQHNREIARFAEALRAASDNSGMRHVLQAVQSIPRVNIPALTIPSVLPNFGELARAVSVSADFAKSISAPIEAARLNASMVDNVAKLAWRWADELRTVDFSGLTEAIRQAAVMATPQLEAIQAAAGRSTGKSTAKGDGVSIQVDAAKLEITGGLIDLKATKWPSTEDMRDTYMRLPYSTRLFIYFVWTFLVVAVGQKLVADAVLRDSDKGDVTIMITEARDVLGDDAVESFRRVRADVLHVRENPARDAAVVARLSSGHLVEVIERQPGWSYVRWSINGTNDFGVGWVATGYLEKAFGLPAAHE